MPSFTDRLLKAHMPKTGGSWLRYHLIDQLGGSSLARQPWALPDHAPIADVPAEIRRGRVAFGTIRDPWSWYLSWYNQASKSGLSAHNVSQFGLGDSSFKEVLYGATHGRDTEAKPGMFWGPSAAKSGFAGGRDGLYTWSARYVYGEPWGIDALVDMPQMLAALAELTGSEQERYKPPLNVGTYTKGLDLGVYDEEMIEWVRSADGGLIYLMGYTDPGVCADGPCTWLQR
jgi:hypothetical protein